MLVQLIAWRWPRARVASISWSNYSLDRCPVCYQFASKGSGLRLIAMDGGHSSAVVHPAQKG
jgi:hypothetical protein